MTPYRLVYEAKAAGKWPARARAQDPFVAKVWRAAWRLPASYCTCRISKGLNGGPCRIVEGLIWNCNAGIGFLRSRVFRVSCCLARDVPHSQVQVSPPQRRDGVLVLTVFGSARFFTKYAVPWARPAEVVLALAQPAGTRSAICGLSSLSTLV